MRQAGVEVMGSEGLGSDEVGIVGVGVTVEAEVDDAAEEDAMVMVAGRGGLGLQLTLGVEGAEGAE